MIVVSLTWRDKKWNFWEVSDFFPFITTVVFGIIIWLKVGYNYWSEIFLWSGELSRSRLLAPTDLSQVKKFGNLNSAEIEVEKNDLYLFPQLLGQGWGKDCSEH